jgi:hypothetical protein
VTVAGAPARRGGGPAGWLAALRGADALVLLLRASLVVLLINGNDDPPVQIGVAVVCVVALPRPALLRRPWLWWSLFAVIGTRQLLTWHTIDDHIIATTYWCGAVGLCLTARNAQLALAATARLLIGSLFAFATAWKLRSGEFLDGSFFRYTLLFDDRFEDPARLIGGTTDAMRQANLDDLSALHASDTAGEILVREGPRNRGLASLFTGWGVLVEAAVAAAFLVPLRERWGWVRHAALVAFAATTYAVVPIGGFGTLLVVLGAAQTTTERARTAYYLGGMALIAWSGVWPILFL